MNHGISETQGVPALTLTEASLPYYGFPWDVSPPSKGLQTGKLFVCEEEGNLMSSDNSGKSWSEPRAIKTIFS